jgi:DNA-binding CsgD family transcriptional regulator
MLIQEKKPPKARTPVRTNYGMFLCFVDYYLPQGFTHIDDKDDLIYKLNATMEKNSQFFYIADMLKLQILYTSPSFEQVLGFPCKEMDPGFLFRSTHPEDQPRHSLSRARMFQLCNDLYIEGVDKYALLSTNLRTQHLEGHYVNLLVQGYVFTAERPIPTTYCLFVNTDIDWFGPIKNGYNHYLGQDMSYFRYPDEELILTGCIFTDREFEIIKLIRDGLNSHAIGKKLFISPHTVDTHRRNMLKKTGFRHCSELVIDLQEKGFF